MRCSSRERPRELVIGEVIAPQRVEAEHAQQAREPAEPHIEQEAELGEGRGPTRTSGVTSMEVKTG